MPSTSAASRRLWHANFLSRCSPELRPVRTPQPCAVRADEHRRVVVRCNEVIEVRGEFGNERGRDREGAAAGVGLRRAQRDRAVVALDERTADRDRFGVEVDAVPGRPASSPKRNPANAAVSTSARKRSGTELTWFAEHEAQQVYGAWVRWVMSSTTCGRRSAQPSARRSNAQSLDRLEIAAVARYEDESVLDRRRGDERVRQPHR